MSVVVLIRILFCLYSVDMYCDGNSLWMTEPMCYDLHAFSDVDARYSSDLVVSLYSPYPAGFNTSSPSIGLDYTLRRVPLLERMTRHFLPLQLFTASSKHYLYTNCLFSF